jgi:hypothetical protein
VMPRPDTQGLEPRPTLSAWWHTTPPASEGVRVKLASVTCSSYAISRILKGRSRREGEGRPPSRAKCASRMNKRGTPRCGRTAGRWWWSLYLDDTLRRVTRPTGKISLVSGFGRRAAPDSGISIAGRGYTGTRAYLNGRVEMPHLCPGLVCCLPPWTGAC